MQTPHGFDTLGSLWLVENGEALSVVNFIDLRYPISVSARYAEAWKSTMRKQLDRTPETTSQIAPKQLRRQYREDPRAKQKDHKPSIEQKAFDCSE